MIPVFLLISMGVSIAGVVYMSPKTSKKTKLFGFIVGGFMVVVGIAMLFV